MTNIQVLPEKVGDVINFNNKQDIMKCLALVLSLSLAECIMLFNSISAKQNKQMEISNIINNDYTQYQSIINNDYAQFRTPLTISNTYSHLVLPSVDIGELESVNNIEPTIKPITLYDTLSNEEISMIEIVIQHEVGNFSKEYKTYVAELIRNRLVSEDFPNTITDVLFQKGQFQGISSWLYSGIVPDEETKAVVKDVFSAESTSHKATFYYNPALSEYESVMWFEYSGDVEFVFEHTETNWGIEYTTRFFV